MAGIGAQPLATVSNPSQRGILTSMVITSGAIARTRSTASAPSAGGDHLEALELEVDPDQLADLRAVVDHEDPATPRLHAPEGIGATANLCAEPEPP